MMLSNIGFAQYQIILSNHHPDMSDDFSGADVTIGTLQICNNLN